MRNHLDNPLTLRPLPCHHVFPERATAASPILYPLDCSFFAQSTGWRSHTSRLFRTDTLHFTITSLYYIIPPLSLLICRAIQLITLYPILIPYLLLCSLHTLKFFLRFPISQSFKQTHIYNFLDSLATYATPRTNISTVYFLTISALHFWHSPISYWNGPISVPAPVLNDTLRSSAIVALCNHTTNHSSFPDHPTSTTNYHAVP